jgi:hypothetical protein
MAAQSSAAAVRAPAPAAGDELDALARTAHPRWEQCAEPFPHHVARDVFPAATYQKLAGAFRSVLDRGLSEPNDGRRLSRRMKGYDAYSLTLTRLGGPLEVFQTRRWHDHLAEVSGVEGTRDVSAALHHHKLGSDNGKVHNDLNPAFFVDHSKDDGVNLNDPKLCHYQTGEVYAAGFTARATVRAVAMLYYLDNPAWQEGDGGETGLYRTPRDPVVQPAAKVPPVNNTLLLFECTPTSYHSFLQNRKHVRNSVILWLHRPMADAVERWGDSKIVIWKK